MLISCSNKVVFNGYAVNENGTTYRQLTYPLNYSSDGDENQKQEIKLDIDGDGKIRKVPDFDYLNFMAVPSLGVYTLSFTPTNAEGKYTVMVSTSEVLTKTGKFLFAFSMVFIRYNIVCSCIFFHENFDLQNFQCFLFIFA